MVATRRSSVAPFGEGDGEYTIIGVTRPDFKRLPSIGIEIFVPVTMVAQLMANY
ncbi:MAG: hypothetical protein IPN47_27910 [Gemmatimonadetes bacterium]|nr:hypothetical protein [Gemmatimonadota bacterium]